MKKIILFISILVIFTGCDLKKLKAEAEEIKKLEIKHVELSNLKNGSYSGKCEYTIVKAEVKVDINEGKITNIELVEHKHGRGKKAESLLDNILQEQKNDVDIVAGATISSKIILKAVENALEE